MNVKYKSINFCGERKKGEKFVIPFMYVETMGVNGVETPDPHFFLRWDGPIPCGWQAPQCPARLCQKWSDQVEWSVGPQECQPYGFLLCICDHRNIS